MTTYVIKNSINDVLRVEQSNIFPLLAEGESAVSTTATFPGWPSKKGVILKYADGSYYEVDTRDLTSLKEDKNAEINAARLAANQSYFIYGGKQIACDPLSRSDIDGVNGVVSLTGSLPSGFPNVWKAMDNTYVPIPNRETWISFYGAMITQGTINFNKSQSLKNQLAAATTKEEVDAITW